MKYKYILYLIVVLFSTVLTVSCSKDPLLGGETPSKKVNWRFSVLMPDARPSTRAFGENVDVTSLHVAVFSPVGDSWFLEEMVQATHLTPVEGSPDNEMEFSVELTESEDNRRIHLIANYKDLSFPFGDDASLVGLESVLHDHDVYWGYVETPITNKKPPRRIPLVRNFAKIAIEVADDVKNFKLTGFGIHNMPDKGTVAPYNNKGRTFAQFMASDNECHTYQELLKDQEYEGNEPYDMNLIAITDPASEGFHVPDADGIVAPFYICERRNHDAENPTSVIVKGKFNGGKETYYKLDIIYQDNEANTNVYYNLLRNFIFTVRITEVKGDGYDTLADALRYPASNNVAGSTEVNDFTNISNGEGHLFVSTTYLLMVNENPVDIYYQYRPDITNPTTVSNDHKGQGAEKPVTITAHTGNNLVLKTVLPANNDVSTATDLHYNWRKITLTPNTPGTAKEQKITIAAGGLQREITLVLRQPYAMTVKVFDKKTYDNNQTFSKKVLGNSAEQVIVRTSIPSGLSPNLFPLLFTYSTAANTLYPLAGSGMYATTGNGTYGFVYELGYEDYSKLLADPNDVTKVMFDRTLQTNCTQNASVVYVDNPYFNRGADYFVNPFVLGAINVSYQRVGGRYPQTIYNNGNNNGKKTGVQVYLNDKLIGTATVNGTQLVSAESNFTIPDEFTADDVVTFTFNDNYYWGGKWNGPTTYTATCKVADLISGTTLNFRTPFSSIRIVEGTDVSLTKTYTSNGQSTEVLPYSFNNNASATKDTVKLGDDEIGTITINRNEVTVGLDVAVPDGYDLNQTSTLTFSFQDRYCTEATYSYYGYYGWWDIKYSNSNKQGWYTAECNVEDIQANDFIITFKHPQP
ncbi:MAG: hypothetical protein IKC18_08840 [Bacteroidaceae bacterium]|nr:hypothetical protein [Bacteroidaceae bacterium]